MNRSKRESRIDAMKIIYSTEFTDLDVLEIAKTILEVEDEEVLKLIIGVKDNLEKIDEIISNSLTNYSITRLNLVDKAIVRLATFEMLDGTAPNIAINEAIEITKEYSDNGDRKAVSFNNRLLDNIKKNILK